MVLYQRPETRILCQEMCRTGVQIMVSTISSYYLVVLKESMANRKVKAQEYDPTWLPKLLNLLIIYLLKC